MVLKNKLINKSEIFTFAIIIALILGLVTSIFFMVYEKDTYSAIYVAPGSIIHNSGNNSVLFSFGVRSSEAGKMDYVLNIYMNKILVETKQFSLDTGESLENRDKISIPPNTQFPLKIELILTTNQGAENVHFWIDEERD